MKKKNELNILKPSEYMRARRPEKFSDTPSLEVPVLEKSFLDYHLETLTSRKQEQAFEEFCRRLAELEICPNLKPQTGPTGGGDSKVDSSTYPVSATLAERCYWGCPNPPSKDEWAFAFSCKKKWKDKVLEDVEKISKLPRNFQKVFFISNQFISDKKRASAEDELKAKYKFDVHILDRSWILGRIIDHGRGDLAITILGIRGLRTEKPQLGPRDMSRSKELDLLISKFGKPEIYEGNDYALAEDYREAGLLSRALGKDRQTVDGFFQRAGSLAQSHDYKSQIIRCGYDHAWTTLWWFDDFSAMERIYSEIENYLIGTDDAEECELFTNMWYLLFSGVQSGVLSPNKAKINDRLAAIRKELSRLGSDSTRPNNALHSQTESYLLDLFESMGDVSKVKKVFDGLGKCLKRCAGLGQYPAKRFIKNLTDLGEVLGDLPGYENLFEEMRKVVVNRLGEVSEGKLLFERGMQLLKKGDLKGALLFLGKARLRLWKDETIKNGIRSAFGCCDAYIGLGLPWAARMEALIVAHTALRTRAAMNEFPIEAALGTIRMASLELSLGRIAPFLAWHELSLLQAGHLKSLGFEIEEYLNDLQSQDIMLGCILLNQPRETLRALSVLRDKLEELHLPMSRASIFYALGEINAIKDELPLDLAQDDKKISEYFEEWKKQFSSDEVPKSLIPEDSGHWRYETTVMGVNYVVKPRNKYGPIVYAENLLGIIEAALALARWENLAFIVNRVEITVEERQDGANPPQYRLDQPPGRDGHSIVWGEDMIKWLHQAQRSRIGDHFMEFLLQLLLSTTIDPFKDLKKELDHWNKQDTFSRAIGMSPTSIPLLDILGKERYDLSYWSVPSIT